MWDVKACSQTASKEGAPFTSAEALFSADTESVDVKPVATDELQHASDAEMFNIKDSQCCTKKMNQKIRLVMFSETVMEIRGEPAKANPNTELRAN